MTKEKETNGYLIFIENNCIYKYKFQTIGMAEWGSTDQQKSTNETEIVRMNKRCIADIFYV